MGRYAAVPLPTMPITSSPRNRKGRQARRAIRLALKEAELSPPSIDAVVAHGTGTRQNDRIEARLLYEVFGPVALTAPKRTHWSYRRRFRGIQPSVGTRYAEAPTPAGQLPLVDGGR